ncbi:DUF4468 domain-containing protein [Lacinutrix sp. C3R15]|uniref:DUF4468 domain-containing protein n=1 Tax=Flavobacteriaceae TaxID=49546 RepID=UPI001C0A50A5|nr:MULTISPECIES: DUF4468 domain-containing protein [Flavobacteriaceae]MBU2940851.1 DUF4468 domain-containing protein [Lacinutrix sp. C3R15]MDO6624169.1 DUF4468 domain-containing protein [Oceanihabitans sp. 1_MG-2023]
MKKVLLLTLTILISNLSIGQEIPQLKLTPNGVKPIVVVVDNLSASEIYNKALNWVQETYKNPDKVLKANIANEKIRIDGFASEAWWFKSLGILQTIDMAYTVEISFKDGKYRFEYIIGQFYVGGGQKAQYSYNSFYKKKNGEIRKTYKDAVPSLEMTMNSLSQSFYDYVIGKSTKKDNDW